MNDKIFYRQKKAVKAGQIERFEIIYTPTHDHELEVNSNLWVKVRNIEPIAMRAAFIAGPYLLYVDCRSDEYNPNEKCFITANQPTFESQLQPSKSFYSELSCNTLKTTYKWTVDVISQMLFSNSMEINFEIVVGTSRQILHEDLVKAEESSSLNIKNFDTFDLWNLPVPKPNKSIHLVILTHGLHSNVSSDMLYLKESIDQASTNDNIVVKGFFGNICKTERGIKYLGSRVAEYIIHLVTNDASFNDNKVNKISFVGHSLGGVVQTFTIAYLENNFPWFFKQITPINFITIASPLLGASNENPIYINLALSAGIVGKTGQDLSLRYNDYLDKPLLLLLPTGPTHKILKRFVRRTVYANIANDGVVPLRTSALLYLDYKGLSSVLSQEALTSHHLQDSSVDKIPDDDSVEKNNEDTSMSILPQPFQMMLAKFLPQKQSKPEPKPGDGKEEPGELDEGKTKNILRQIKGLHKSSVIETAQSLILPPFPPMSYIVNPEERGDTIVYEKVYNEEDLPPRETKEKAVTGTDGMEKDGKPTTQPDTLRQKLMSTIDIEEFEKIEEEIAREYHKGMSWKKVLIKLKPDAHNNIIVRRRFSNAYGWPVINHIIEEHFNEKKARNGLMSSLGIGLFNDKNDSLDEVGLGGILSRDLIRKENMAIEETESKDHSWINHKDKDSFFDVGPAGLLSDVSEMVVNLRDQWYRTYTGNEVELNPVEAYDNEIEYKVTGDFV